MSTTSPLQAYGNIVNLARTDPRHFAGMDEQVAPTKSVEQSFGDLLVGALNNVNDSQVTANTMAEQMITNPDSVDIQDVMIAGAEANLAISMTKAIVDRAIAAYREIINVR